MGFWALVASFAPWIVLKIIAHLPFGNPAAMLKTAVSAATLVCFVQAATDKTRGLIFWGSILFFAISFIFVVLFSNEWASVHMGVLAQVQLALMAWGSVALKQPFTMVYARRHVPESLWKSPRFIQKNYMISSAWGAAFSVGAAVSFVQLYHPDVSWLFLEVVNDGSMLGVILFTVYASKPTAAKAVPAN